MIEIKLILLDATEIQMAAQLQSFLEQKRAAQYAAPAAPIADVPAPTTAGTPRTESERANVEAAAAPVATVPSDIEVAKAITIFAQTAGIDKAKALLEEFGAKRVMEVPVERRAELLARLAVVS